MLEILKYNRNVRVISVANFINRLGDSVETIAYTYLLYLLTGSSAVSALGLCINLLPSVIIQPLISPFVEKCSKKRIMVWTDYIRGLLILIIVFESCKGSISYGLLMFVNFLSSSVECIRIPAGMSIVPQICRAQEYDSQASLSSLISSVTMICGTLLGSVLLGVTDISVIYMFDSVSFVLSGSILMALQIKETEVIDQKDNEKYFQSLIGGLKYLKTNKVLVGLVILCAVNNILEAPFSALQAPIINGILGGGVGFLSIISVSGTIGMIAGSLLYEVFYKKFGKKILYISILSYALLYLSIIMLAELDNETVIIAVFSFINIFCVIIQVWLSIFINSNFIKNVTPEYIGRSSAIFGAVAAATMPVCSFILAMVVDITGIYAILKTAISAAVIATVILFAKISHTPDGIYSK